MRADFLKTAHRFRRPIGKRAADAQVDPAVEALVYAEQVDALYSKGLIALVVNTINSAVVVAVLWRLIHHGAALAWLLVMNLIVAARIGTWYLHRSSRQRAAQSELWERVWTVGTAMTGAVWGASAFWVYPSGSPIGQDLLVFVIGGMVAGASATMSSRSLCFTAFTVPALALPIIRLLMENDALHSAKALFLVIFGAAMSLIAHTGARTLTESIRLRWKNTNLALDLGAAREQLTKVNRELEQRVADRTRELERAVADRERFVSVVSHELRSPLTSMMLNRRTMGRLLGTTTVSERFLRLFASLSTQMDRMSRLVDDLLDMGRLSADRMRYQLEPVNLAELVRETLAELEPQLEASHLDVAIDVEEGLWGNWDRFRIRQLLVNIVSNALRYGKEPISVSTHRTDSRVSIMIRDAGPGIPPDDLARIFAPFERGKTESRASGLGLGLFIAQQIARAHGGTIRVDSQPGQGAVFTVELPLHQPA
jgi:signal transduction histidine kinase